MGIVSEGVDLLRLANKVQNADLYKQLAEWIDKVTELQRENDGLREERNELSEQLRLKGTLQRINGHVFVEGDDEEICPRCAESELKLIHLIPHRSSRPPYQRAWCPKCEIEFLHNLPYSRALANQKQNPGD